MATVEFSPHALMDGSTEWGIVKVTIANPAASISPDFKAVKSCKIYHFSGTKTYLARSSAADTDLELPTTLSTAFVLPIDNLAKLSFYGTAGDVACIVWRN